MTKKTIAAALLVLTGALSACRPKPVDRNADAGPAFAPPAGKRAFSLAIDKSQTRFLAAGDVVDMVMLVEKMGADGSDETRSEILSPRAEVLRVRNDWGEDSGLIQLALTPEEAQYAALAVEREDRLFLNKLSETANLSAVPTPARPTLAPGSRGFAVLVYPDQQEFLEPGSRVDVIALRRDGKSAGKAELTAATLFQNVTVLGVYSAQGDEERSSVQLMLAPAQAETMARAAAAENGLVLAARAPGDDATRPVEPAKMSRRAGSGRERGSSKS